MDGEFQAYLAENEIMNQNTCVHTPAQKGVAKRRTLST